MLNGVAATAGVMRTMENLLRGINGNILTGDVVPKVEDGQEMLRLSKMSDLEELSKEHWPHLRIALPDRLHNGAPLDAQVFAGMFRRLREARNACFHHKQVPDRLHIASNAELLLDLIDIRIGTEIEGAASAFVKPFPFQVECTERHGYGLCDQSDFVLEVGTDAATESRSVRARSRGEALVKVVEALSVEERETVTSLALRVSAV